MADSPSLSPPAWLGDLFERLPGVFAADFRPEAPWELLGAPLDRVLAALPDGRIDAAIGPDVHLVGGPFVIGKGTRILPGAVLEGPVFLGEDVLIRPGVYIRGGAWIGDGCLVGAGTEIKRGILLPGAKAPHLNYVGDSILGSEVNLGAGTILSNLRHDKAEIGIPHAGGRISTGRRKLGAVLGDRVLTGCNCVLNPGVVVGRGTQIYPLALVRSSFVPPDSLVKLRQTVQVLERR